MITTTYLVHNIWVDWFTRDIRVLFNFDGLDTTRPCNSTICQQVVSDNLVATWWNNSIVTTCWQTCYKPVANTSCWQVVRFLYVCIDHRDIDILYTLDSASNYSTIQKLKPWLHETQDIPMKWEDSYMFSIS
jgi:hypothetical protein